MKIIGWWVLFFGLIFVRNVQAAEVGGLVKGNCGWCGLSCTRVSASTSCIQIAPPQGKQCLEVNGICKIETIDGIIRQPSPRCVSKTVQCVREPCPTRMMCDSLTPFPTRNLPITGAAKLTPTGTISNPSNVAGDANGDRKINLEDLMIWKNEYLGAVGKRADFNKDGKVDLVDFTIFKKAYLLSIK